MTYAALVEYFARHGLPRKISAFGNFERGEVKTPSAEFVELWAKACGRKPAEVRLAHLKTRRLRSRGAGPFAKASVSPRSK